MFGNELDCCPHRRPSPTRSNMKVANLSAEMKTHSQSGSYLSNINILKK
uniref:Uncharacterized protein n=1 Tax=Anguilla anguilla TaxID=7936 RepID=A0A0E9VDR5_ANGAN